MALPGIASVDTALRGSSDMGLWQPLLEAGRLLERQHGEPLPHARGLPPDLLLRVAAAARGSGNLGLAERLVQECGRALERPSGDGGAEMGFRQKRRNADVRLELAVQRAALVWSQGARAQNGNALRTAAVQQLLDRLTAPVVDGTKGPVVSPGSGCKPWDSRRGALQARAWLQLHSWLPHTEGRLEGLGLGGLPAAQYPAAALGTPEDGAAATTALAALHLSPQRNGAGSGVGDEEGEGLRRCIGEALWADATNAEAWHLLADWFYDTWNALHQAARAGDVHITADIQTWRQHALAAYCRGLALCGSRLTEV